MNRFTLLCFLALLLSVVSSAQEEQRRSLADLISSNSAWPRLSTLIDSASNQVQVLEADSANAAAALFDLQLSTRSSLGAVVYETGGILVDSCWLRILGSGSALLARSVPTWNTTDNRREKQADKAGYHCLVADDVVGGFFSINWGALGNDLGKVYYFAPDKLYWEPMNMNYEQFLGWCFSGDLALFYKRFRWYKWQTEVAEMAPDQAFMVFPPLFTGPEPLSQRSRNPVPTARVYKVEFAFRDKVRERHNAPKTEAPDPTVTLDSAANPVDSIQIQAATDSSNVPMLPDSVSTDSMVAPAVPEVDEFDLYEED